jgi:hypothetical protein
MPIRGSPRGAHPTCPQVRRGGRDRPERVVVIDWNEWSSSIGTGGRHHPVRAVSRMKNDACPLNMLLGAVAIADDGRQLRPLFDGENETDGLSQPSSVNIGSLTPDSSCRT